MIEQNEKVVEEITTDSAEEIVEENKEQPIEEVVEKTIDESKFKSAGNPDIIKVDLSQPPAQTEQVE